MNIQEIDKWLDNEYGCSYTRLEELHDYFFEKYTDQKEEIERLNNIINELEKWLKGGGIIDFDIEHQVLAIKDILNKLQELKGSEKE